ncbi:Uncharacterised protein [Halioglobus japonicus]|nr:Uncharacterised protein [Halioglobus japonicus]
MNFMVCFDSGIHRDQTQANALHTVINYDKIKHPPATAEGKNAHNY